MKKDMIIEKFNTSLLPQEIPEIKLTQPTPAKKVLKRPEIKIEDFPKRFTKSSNSIPFWLSTEIQKKLSQKSNTRGM